MFKRAVAAPASEVAGPISPNRAIEGIGLEEFRSQIRVVPISICEKSAPNEDLANRTRRNKRTCLIFYRDFHPVSRPTNRNDTNVRKTRGGEDLGRDRPAFCRRKAMSDAPIAFEMPGDANNVSCVNPFVPRLDDAERRKPKIVG